MRSEPVNATGSREQANNAKLKRLLADTLPDNVVLKDLLEKN